jgi:hypothetical protein
MPSFSRMWSLPVPKLSSPQMASLPASIRLPKNFHPVGTCAAGGSAGGDRRGGPFYCSMQGRGEAREEFGGSERRTGRPHTLTMAEGQYKTASLPFIFDVKK